jgi:hypothetical protein
MLYGLGRVEREKEERRGEIRGEKRQINRRFYGIHRPYTKATTMPATPTVTEKAREKRRREAAPVWEGASAEGVEEERVAVLLAVTADDDADEDVSEPSEAVVVAETLADAAGVESSWPFVAVERYSSTELSVAVARTEAML